MTIKDTLQNWIRETLDLDKDLNFTLEYPADASHGDFACNVAMILAKDLGKNPRELAEEFAEKLRGSRLPFIFDIEVAGPGFINIKLTPEIFSESIEKIIKAGEKIGEHNHYSGKRILVEHTATNAFKEFHVGHVMTNVIGESVSRIIEEEGAEVVRLSYHSDVGLNVAKAVWGMQSMEVSLGIDEKKLGEAYALGSKIYESNEVAKQEIIEINKKIYDKSDEKINKLYEIGREVSLKYFDTIYERLGSHFEEHFYESQSGPIGKEIVLEFLDKGVFQKSDGAVVFKGEDFGLHTRVFVNSEGLPTYEGKEIGLMKIKRDKYAPFDLSITITANEQDSFFKVTKKALEHIFPELNGKLLHLSHGILKLPSGKMSSRTGDVLTADSLIDVLSNSAKEKIKNDFLGESERNQIGEVVGLGAFKFTVLRQAIGGDIVFDINKSLSLEGDSGPYLQYATVRAKSLIKKSKEELEQDLGNELLNNIKISAKHPEGWQVLYIERLLERFPSMVNRASLNYAPHILVTYLTELAGEFNSFYGANKIIDINDPKSSYRLAITQAFANVMTRGLYLLGIKVPEEM